MTKVTCLLKKNDHRSVIDITFIPGMVFHMVAILTYNKGNADVENILNDDEFFGDIVDTPKEDIDQHKKTRMLKECHRQWQGLLFWA